MAVAVAVAITVTMDKASISAIHLRHAREPRPNNCDRLSDQMVLLEGCQKPSYFSLPNLPPSSSAPILRMGAVRPLSVNTATDTCSDPMLVEMMCDFPPTVLYSSKAQIRRSLRSRSQAPIDRRATEDHQAPHGMTARRLHSYIGWKPIWL